MNLSALAAIKGKMRKSSIPCEVMVDDAELAELGLPSSLKDEAVALPTPTHLPSMERNCGNCVRWKICTVAHRNGRVSPKLSACEAFEYSSRQ